MKIFLMLFGLLWIAAAFTSSGLTDEVMTPEDRLAYNLGRWTAGAVGFLIMASPYLLAGIVRKLQSMQPKQTKQSAMQNDAAMRNAFRNTGSFFSKPADDDVVPLAKAP
jgi:hypothetical protein